MTTNISKDQNKLYINKLKEENSNLNIRNDILTKEIADYRGKVKKINFSYHS